MGSYTISRVRIWKCYREFTNNLRSILWDSTLITHHSREKGMMKLQNGARRKRSSWSWRKIMSCIRWPRTKMSILSFKSLILCLLLLKISVDKISRFKNQIPSKILLSRGKNPWMKFYFLSRQLNFPNCTIKMRNWNCTDCWLT